MIRLPSALKSCRPFPMVASLVSGFVLSYSSVLSVLWLVADPGCDCPAEKLAISRKWLLQWSYVPLLCSFPASYVAYAAFTRIKPPVTWLNPFSIACLCALTFSAVATAFDWPGGYFSTIPFDILAALLLPDVVAEATGAVYRALQTWRFAATALVFLVAYGTLRWALRPRQR